MKQKIFSLLACTVALVGSFSLAYASGTLGIQPLRSEVDIKPNETKLITFTLTNPSDEETIARPLIESYSNTDNEGYPILESDAGDDPQSLVNWIELPKENITIAPRSVVEIDAKIIAPANAGPGGHYAAVIFEPVINDDAAIKVKARVASLVVVRVDGEMVEEAELTSFKAPDTVYTDQGFDFSAHMQNTGTVHLKPLGKIYIKDAEGNQLQDIGLDPDTKKPVDYVVFNSSKGNVLPESERDILGTWQAPKNLKNMTAILEVEYGKNNPISVKKEIKFNINAGVKITNFQYNPESKNFTFTLKNTGDALVMPEFTLDIFSGTSFQVDALTYKGEDYLTAGEEKLITVPWETTPAGGNYIAKINFTSSMLEDYNAEYEFSVTSGGLLASVFSGGNAGVMVIGLFMVIMAAAFYFLGKRKQAPVNNTPAPAQNTVKSEQESQENIQNITQEVVQPQHNTIQND